MGSRHRMAAQRPDFQVRAPAGKPAARSDGPGATEVSNEGRTVAGQAAWVSKLTKLLIQSHLYSHLNFGWKLQTPSGEAGTGCKEAFRINVRNRLDMRYRVILGNSDLVYHGLPMVMLPPTCVFRCQGHQGLLASLLGARTLLGAFSPNLCLPTWSKATSAECDLHRHRRAWWEP